MLLYVHTKGMMHAYAVSNTNNSMSDENPVVPTVPVTETEEETTPVVTPEVIPSVIPAADESPEVAPTDVVDTPIDTTVQA